MNRYLSRYAKEDTHFHRTDPTPWIPIEGSTPRWQFKHSIWHEIVYWLIGLLMVFLWVGVVNGRLL